MFTMILISSVAIFVGIFGCAFIWGLDMMRAQEIERPRSADPAVRTALSGVTPDVREIDRR